LVTTSATFRSVFDNAPFYTSQVEAKGESDDFQEFLRTAKDPDEIWFRLVTILIAYEKNLPAELRSLRPRLDAMRMRLQWLQHADLILRNRAGRYDNRPDYPAVRAELDAELARLRAQERSP
jgi:hypothetical protein